MEEFHSDLSIGLANIIAFTNPEVIALGGAPSSASDFMLDAVRGRVDELTTMVPRGTIRSSSSRNSATTRVKSAPLRWHSAVVSRRSARKRVPVAAGLTILLIALYAIDVRLHGYSMLWHLVALVVLTPNAFGWQFGIDLDGAVKREIATISSVRDTAPT